MSITKKLTANHSHLNDFQLFSTVHRFFVSMSQLNDHIQDDLDFDISSLESDILACKTTELLDEKEIEIAARLSLWRQSLEQFDADLPAGTIRQHFEEWGIPDSLTLEMLLSFYLSKSFKTLGDRDKIDLIATWWGQSFSQMREHDGFNMPVPSLRGRIEKIYRDLGLTPMPNNEIRDTLEMLEYERKRLLTVRSLRELIERQVLKHLRRVKKDIGDLLFQPAILSEVVALNICLHTAFRSLFLAEQSRLAAFLPNRQNSELDMRATVADRKIPNYKPATPPIKNDEPPAKKTAALGAELLRMHLPSDNTPSKTVTIDRADLLKLVQSIRTMISVLDQHLQPLVDKLDS